MILLVIKLIAIGPATKLVSERDVFDSPLRFARFDAAPKSVTAPPAAAQQAADAGVLSRVLSSGLYGSIRNDLLPEVSSVGSNTRWSVQA